MANGMPDDYGSHFKFIPIRGEDVNTVKYTLEIFKVSPGTHGYVFIKAGGNNTWKQVTFDS